MSIADFLFPTPIQNILRLVYGAPEQIFMLKDLLDRAGTGRGNGARHVDKLIAYGVLSEEPRAGHQRRIRANKMFPLYAELRSISVKSFGLLEPIRTALLPFQADIAEAFVFGSVAKRRDTHQSDIDLMVIGTVDLTLSTDALLSIETVLGREIHLNLYSEDEWRDLQVRDPVLQQIAKSSTLRILPDDTAR